MGYFNSTIKLRPDGLYKATIRYNYLYFFLSEKYESFKTLGEAKEWILKERCPEHKEIVTEEQEEQYEEKEVQLEGNAFENDSEDEPLSDTDCETTEQQRNVRLNKFMLNEELKKKKPTIINNRRCKKWNVRFQNK